MNYDTPFWNREWVNIDIGFRCPLQCPTCQREVFGVGKDHRDLTIDEFKKVAEKFKRILFCGQYSDPIHHPNFIDFLKICQEKNISVKLSTASSFKSMDWFIEAWKAYPRAEWIFAIDGLPEESHNYRVNQDGVKLFNIMLESKKYLQTKPHWQYIILSYNQDHVKEALALAKEHDVHFYTINSIRTFKDHKHLKGPELRKK